MALFAALVWLTWSAHGVAVVAHAPAPGTGLSVRARPEGGLVVLFRGRVVDSTKSHAPDVYRGQVNGRYAVWAMGVDGVYSVRRYDARTHRTIEVPGTTYAHPQYAPAVAASGVVYFARSGTGCGGAAVFRWDGRRTTPLARLGRHVDVIASVRASDGLYLKLGSCDERRRRIVRLAL